jgi:hypothetical protein
VGGAFDELAVDKGCAGGRTEPIRHSQGQRPTDKGYNL